VSFDFAKTLSDLVAIPSVNPMGRPVLGPEFLEYRVTEYLEQFFQTLKVPYQRQTIDTRRENIIARLDGVSADGRSTPPVILLEAHQDTVPTDGMTIEPWTPKIEGDRLYGRGSCDIKGGMTAILGTFARLVAESPKPRPTVIVACTVNEEHGFTGAQGLQRLWKDAGSIFPKQPDMAIVMEPTRLDIVTAHKGMVRWKCRTHGRAAHSSLPHLGDNAIYRMGSVLAALDRYQREVVPFLGEHPLCGRPTLSVGTISGGISVNTVPDICTIEIDRRLLPGDDPQQAYQHAVDYVAANVPVPSVVEHLPPGLHSTGLSDAINSDLANNLAVAVRDVVGCVNKIGVTFGTNAAAFGTHFPTVVFGPGSIDQAHTADEWVSIDEVRLASEILYRFTSQCEA